MMVLLNIVCPVAAFLCLLFCGAFFASSETAYTSLSKITIHQMLKNRERNAKKVSALKNNLDSLISTTLIGTNFVTTLMSSLATAFAMAVFGPQSVSAAIFVVTVLVIIFSEIVPKTYAAVKPKESSQNSATALSILQKVLFPAVWFFNQFGKFINLIERIFFKKRQPLVTQEELRTLLDVGEHEGTLEQDERKMLERIFEFSDLRVHDIMRHRSLVSYISESASLDEVIEAFAKSGYSRLPVYKDSPETVTGVLHYKAVLFAGPEITSSKDFVRICMVPVMFVPESLSAVELLGKFKFEKSQFAVAVNEYGSTAGIVTMDDILREVFGRVTDEYGMSDIPAEQKVRVLNVNEFLVPGDMKLEDVNDVLSLNLDSEVSETLGGWLLEKLGELPPTGTVYKNQNSIFIIEDQSSRRIQSVRIKLN